MGTYHNVSKKYLPLYLNEFQFRFNNRKNPDIFRDSDSRMLRRPNWQVLLHREGQCAEAIASDIPESTDAMSE